MICHIIMYLATDHHVVDIVWKQKEIYNFVE